jgi:hypothetical protein
MGFLDRFLKPHPPSGMPRGDPLQPPSLDDVPRDPSVTATPTLPEGERVPVVGESYYQDAYIKLFGRPGNDWRHFDNLVAELVPEPHNEYDPAAVAVRVHGEKVGHLSRDDARSFRAAIDEAITSHGRATAGAEVRCGPPDTGARASDFGTLLYFSDRPMLGAPPAADEIRLADGGDVSVSYEEHYQDVLVASTRGRGVAARPYPVVATLVRADDGSPWAKKPTGPLVEVRIGSDTVGYLTRAMSDRYMRFVDDAAQRGKRLTSAALLQKGTKSGTRVVEIRLDALPRRRDQRTVEELDVEITAELVIDARSGILHHLAGQRPDGSCEAVCGLRIKSTEVQLVGKTSPWVGRVEVATGRIYDDRHPWCDRC